MLASHHFFVHVVAEWNTFCCCGRHTNNMIFNQKWTTNENSTFIQNVSLFFFSMYHLYFTLHLFASKYSWSISLENKVCDGYSCELQSAVMECTKTIGWYETQWFNSTRQIECVHTTLHTTIPGGSSSPDQSNSDWYHFYLTNSPVEFGYWNIKQLWIIRWITSP